MNDAAAAGAEQRADAAERTAMSQIAPPLKGLLVVEHGERLGARVCGSLLAQLGAEVAVVERTNAQLHGEALTRACNMLGKRSIAIRDDRESDQRLLHELLEAADVVLTSSDVSSGPVHASSPHQIVCDITAFGASGPLSSAPYSDGLVQAVTGLADTTGDPEGAPTLIGFPFCEVSAGIYAAAAAITALRVRRTCGFGQAIDVALFDCAVSALSTFLPFHVIGRPVTRAGNRHSLAAPWNAYRAADGWVLICTATDDQWRRLCSLIGRPELGRANGYATNAERVARRGDIDEVLRHWTSGLTVEQCIARLSGIDIACGPILTLDQLKAEANLVHRHMVQKYVDPDRGMDLALPGSPLALSAMVVEAGARIPAPDEDRAYLHRLVESRMSRRSRPELRDSRGLPLSGLRVIEIGQYTTAPLVARQLGALGAEVYKVEPPGGEGSRAWPPTQGNRGYFFAFSNSDKRSLELDLRKEGDREMFRSLLRTGDVLVENLKPGSLARLGFARDELGIINPRLVYCGISGFGANSVYPGRPAFDTVVQAMSGFMDLTGRSGVPMKAGISAADIIGGEFALLAILAALEARDESGKGQALDISMQDAAVWATASLWNAKSPGNRATFVRCADGYVCVEDIDQRAHAEVARWANAELHSREEVVRWAQRARLAAAPVSTVSEVAQSAQARARQLIIEKTGDDGRIWPLLNSPLRLQATPPEVKRAIGELGEANAELSAALASATTRAAAQQPK